jgi:hypothetical protein
MKKIYERISEPLDGFLCGANLPMKKENVKKFEQLDPRPSSWEDGKNAGLKSRRKLSYER